MRNFKAFIMHGDKVVSKVTGRQRHGNGLKALTFTMANIIARIMEVLKINKFLSTSVRCIIFVLRISCLANYARICFSVLLSIRPKT